jgi:hypothetical protein
MIITDQSILLKEFSIVRSSTTPKTHIIKPTDQSINQSINKIIKEEEERSSSTEIRRFPT